MTSAVPPPDRDRPVLLPRRRRRPAAAPLKPAAVAGMALLLALATLREPIPVASTEDGWAQSAQYLPGAGHDADEQLIPTTDSSARVTEGAILLQPVAISDGAALDGESLDATAAIEPEVFDEARAAAVALRLASRLAWQVTGSFTFAPFAGVWTAPQSPAPAMDSGIAIEQ